MREGLDCSAENLPMASFALQKYEMGNVQETVWDFGDQEAVKLCGPRARPRARLRSLSRCFDSDLVSDFTPQSD